MTEVHVIPDERTTWRVCEGGAVMPISEHTNATEAEQAAHARAEERDADRVVVHDRYHRTHELLPSPTSREASETSSLPRGVARDASASPRATR